MRTVYTVFFLAPIVLTALVEGCGVSNNGVAGYEKKILKKSGFDRDEYELKYNMDSTACFIFNEKARMSGELLDIHVFKVEDGKEIFKSTREYFNVEWYNNNTIKLTKTKLLTDRSCPSANGQGNSVYYDLNLNKFVKLDKKNKSYEK